MYATVRRCAFLTVVLSGLVLVASRAALADAALEELQTLQDCSRELAKIDAELAEKEGYLRPALAQLQQLKGEIEAVGATLDDLNAKMDDAAARAESLAAQGQVDEANALVDWHNSQVPYQNSLAEQKNGMIDRSAALVNEAMPVAERFDQLQARREAVVRRMNQLKFESGKAMQDLQGAAGGNEDTVYDGRTPRKGSTGRRKSSRGVPPVGPPVKVPQGR